LLSRTSLGVDVGLLDAVPEQRQVASVKPGQGGGLPIAGASLDDRELIRRHSANDSAPACSQHAHIVFTLPSYFRAILVTLHELRSRPGGVFAALLFLLILPDFCPQGKNLEE
jgi:hypothetical protein